MLADPSPGRQPATSRAHRRVAAAITDAPARIIARSVKPGATAVRPAELLPLLVLESWRSAPLWPLLVASTLGSIVTVFAVFVSAVVANVCDLLGSTADCASEER